MTRSSTASRSAERKRAARPKRAAAGEGALADVKVLELGSMLAGPFVGTMLADFGATVVKVEKPGKPDALREWPPHKDGQPLWWKAMARNKRLITLDISLPAARRIALALMRRSDVVIENFRPGTLERWGFDPKRLAKRYPHLVWVRVSGYGQDGPYRDRGGYATIAEAYSGLASFTGFADRGPMVSAFPLGDYLAGIFGAYGALAALHHRDRTGRGQIVDVSLFEPFLRIIEASMVRFDQLGQKKARLGNEMEEDIPRNVYATADGGHIAVSCGSQRIVDNLLDAIGRPELKADPRFVTVEARVEHRRAVDDVVKAWMATVKTAAGEEILRRHGVVAGRVYDIADVLADAHVHARRAVAAIADPELGSLRVPAPVPKLSATPGRVAWTGKAPGADNATVLGDWLDLGKATLERLAKAGVI